MVEVSQILVWMWPVGIWWVCKYILHVCIYQVACCWRFGPLSELHSMYHCELHILLLTWLPLAVGIVFPRYYMNYNNIVVSA